MEKILIVDDNDHLARHLAERLQEAGHETITALNGMAALKVLADYTPDIIFCDYFLPNLNGDKLCRIIRRMGHLKDTFVVIMSAAASELDLDPAAMGADALIAKGSFQETERHIFAAVEDAARHRAGTKRQEIKGIDIVSPRRITRELLEKNRHLQTILDSISDGIAEVCSGQIVYANPAAQKILGQTQDQLLAVFLPDLFEQGRREEVSAIAAAGSGGADTVERIVPRDRPERLLSLKRLPFVGDGETVILLMTDITARVQAERSLQDYQDHLEALVEERTADLKQAHAMLQQVQKLEAIGTLAGGIAHDFNNILGVMVGYMELAQIGGVMDSLEGQYISKAIEVSSRAKDIINQILIFSRHQEQERKPVLLVPVVKEEVKLLQSLLPSTIRIAPPRIAGGPFMILADVTKVQQVLMNLCTNAFHAMRENGGILEIGLEREKIAPDALPHRLNLAPGDYVKLSVSDTGKGIEPAILGRIFDPFFTTKGPGEGTGLGLSVVFGIVRDYEGAVDVTSVPGSGTTVSIYLPLIATTEPSEMAAVEPIKRGTERILLVDDEAAMVDVALAMLNSLGYRVTARRSSVETLELFRAHPGDFDLVITDMTMPGLRGDELARQLLAIRPDIPIVLCTGFSEMVSEEKAREIGIRRFIMKPMYMRDLAKAVREALDEGR